VFEDLCFHLLKARHPELKITKVEGAGGDKGVDLFAGNLDRGPIIWQCKYFVNHFANSQKRQIKRSLSTSRDHFQPAEWVLCVPINLTIEAIRWFQGLQAECGASMSLGLFCASDILEQLFLRPHLAEAYFPGAMLSPAIIKAQLAGTDELDTARVSILATESHDHLLFRLREQDARFDYQISYRGEFTKYERLPPGLVASYFDGRKQIDLFARDIDGLKTSPPATKIRFKPSAQQKLDRIFKKGTTEEFGPDEAKIESCSFQFLFPSGALDEITSIRLGSQPPHERLLFRVVASDGVESAQLNCVEFKCARLGIEEVELASTDLSLPLVIRIVQGPGRTGSFGFARNYVGKPLSDVLQAIGFEKVLARGASIEFYDLKRGALISRADSLKGATLLTEPPEELVRTLMQISAHFGWSGTYPANITEDDRQLICALLELIEYGRIAISASNLGISAELVRLQDEGAVEKYLTNEFGFESSVGNDCVALFGRELRLGPAKTVFRHLTFKNRETVIKHYRALSEGQTLQAALESRSDGEFILLDHPASKSGIEVQT
jgi:hypothetical protein